MELRYTFWERFLLGLLFTLVVLSILPLTVNPAGDIKTFLFQLFVLPLVALWVFNCKKPMQPLLKLLPLSVLLTTFLVLYFFASVFSLNAAYSLLREFSRIAALFIVFVIASDAFRTPQQVWRFILVACIGICAASFYGFVQYAGLDPFPWDDSAGMLRSAPATFGNPNYASHVLAPVLILASGLAFQAKRRWCLFFVLVFVVHFSLTRTRGSLLGVAAAFFLVLTALALSRFNLRPFRAVVMTGTVLLVAGCGAAASVMAYSYYAHGRVYPYDRGEAIACRYSSFYGACVAAAENPLLGKGPGMYQVVSPRYWTPFEQERFKRLNRMNHRVHNEPLDIAVEAGIPAGIVYVAILLFGMFAGLFCWYSSGSFSRRSLGLSFAAFYLCFFIDGLFGFNFHLPTSALLLFLVSGAVADAK